MQKVKIHPADQMTPVERKQAVESGKSFDRMPVNLFMPDIKARMIECNISDLYNDVDKIIEAEVHAYEKYGSDWMFTGPNSKGIASSLGVKVEYFNAKLPKIAEYILTDYSQLNQIEPVQIEESERLQLFKRVAEGLADKAAGVVNISISLGGPLTIASYFRGTEILLRDLRKNPANLHQLLRIIVETQKNVVDAYQDIPGLTFALADPVASGSLLSPTYFKEFSLPYLNELADYIYRKRLEGPSLHMCGKMERFWPEIKTLNLSTFSIDNASDLKEAVDYFADRFPITGNVPPVDIMYNGDKEKIFQAVIECIRAVEGNPHKCTLGVGCDIPYNAPLENINYYMEAVRHYGNYEQLQKYY